MVKSFNFVKTLLFILKKPIKSFDSLNGRLRETLRMREGPDDVTDWRETGITVHDSSIFATMHTEGERKKTCASTGNRCPVS